MKEIVLSIGKPIYFMETKVEKELARVKILEKEIELGCELDHDSWGNYTKGRKLDEDELQGRKYMLSTQMPF